MYCFHSEILFGVEFAVVALNTIITNRNDIKENVLTPTIPNTLVSKNAFIK